MTSAKKNKKFIMLTSASLPNLSPENCLLDTGLLLNRVLLGRPSRWAMCRAEARQMTAEKTMFF